MRKLVEWTFVRLVDEYYFSKAPVIVGSGEPLFEGVEAAFEVREATTFASGIVVLRCGLEAAQPLHQA